MSKQTENLIKQGESQNIEFKDSLSLKREIGETVSAFSSHTSRILSLLHILPHTDEACCRYQEK
jgi:hypothetical protein